MDSSAPVVLAIQNDASCPPALAAEWLVEDGLEVRVIHAYAGESVPTAVPEGVSALLPLGGRIGANDEDVAPWLVQERALLQDATECGVPVLGLCLGGQLLAAANGGEVSVHDVVEVGVSDVARTLDGLADPVISQARPIDSDLVPAAQWHGDHISRLPDGAVLLMTNDLCHVQAFRLGETAYGLQMHPEVDVPTFAGWVDESPEVIPKCSTTASAALSMVSNRSADLIRVWRPAVRAWGELVWRHARTEAALDS
jgi:GMP synthase (glutamine-hydrolysing)